MKRHYATILGLAAALAAGPAWSQAFPSSPISLVVPWPAGGGSDISMRLLAESATRTMGVPVVVVNKPGAGGSIGIREALASAPDGYTVVMIAAGAVAAQYMNPNANSIAEMEPIAFFGEEPAALSARAETGFKTVKDFVDAAKARPGGIKNGNDQPGGSSFVAIAVLETRLGIKVTRVPYAGFAPTVVALLSGEVDTSTVPVPDIIEHHKSGKARLLGVAAEQRHFLAPDVPTFKEQGFNVVSGSWRAIAGPKGLPADRLRVLEAKFLEAMRAPEFQQKARAAGFMIDPRGAADTAKRVQAEDTDLYPVLLEAQLVKARQK